MDLQQLHKTLTSSTINNFHERIMGARLNRLFLSVNTNNEVESTTRPSLQRIPHPVATFNSDSFLFLLLLGHQLVFLPTCYPSMTSWVVPNNQPSQVLAGTSAIDRLRRLQDPPCENLLPYKQDDINQSMLLFLEFLLIHQ